MAMLNKTVARFYGVTSPNLVSKKLHHKTCTICVDDSTLLAQPTDRSELGFPSDAILLSASRSFNRSSVNAAMADTRLMLAPMKVGNRRRAAS